MKSSLESKTIRPGLMNYSFYAANRRPLSAAPKRRVLPQSINRHNLWPVVIGLALLAGLLIGFKSVQSQTPTSTTNSVKTSIAPPTSNPTTPVVASLTNNCAGNNLTQLIKVSISQRHLWACQGTKAVYDTAVVTGMENLAADKTPTGTYQIYAKQTNVTLTGSDTTGAWSDPVDYWMPFLDNQYGSYGLHDANWRPANAFGNIDPNSAQASHGCVELPLSASKWLYNWAQVGTTVTIET